MNDENVGDEKERAKDIVEEIEKWSAEREDEKPEKTAAYLRGIPKVVEQGPKSASTLVNLQVRIGKNWQKRRILPKTKENEKSKIQFCKMKSKKGPDS